MRAQLGCGRRVAVGNNIGHQTLFTALVIECDSDCLPNFVVGGQRRFDLAQLDAKSADFYLMIAAAAILKATIGEIAAEIARPK